MQINDMNEYLLKKCDIKKEILFLLKLKKTDWLRFIVTVLGTTTL